MNKTALKIFTCFTILSTAVAVILLLVNSLGIVLVGQDDLDQNVGVSPQRALVNVEDHLLKTEQGFELSDPTVLPANYWCMLIDEKGDVVWSQHMPSDIPTHYSLNDVAAMTRWFLNDYPVYVRTGGEGLLVLGMPKDAVGKYDISYSMAWFEALSDRLLAVLLINVIFAFVLALIFGRFLYRRIASLSEGVCDLQQEKAVALKEKGIFKELNKKINDTSQIIQRKNMALAAREEARRHWISGISHDIRTPLSLVLGHAEALENDEALSAENRQKAEVITAQSLKMKNLIEDLNLISSLEYDMQPSQKKPVRLCPLIRETVSAILNSGMADHCDLNLDLQDETITVLADDFLLERALTNLIGNSITHNPKGCRIQIRVYAEGTAAKILLADNGCGVPDSVIAHMTKIPESAHGLGLPMAYKIISVHGGKMTAWNDNGFIVAIELPRIKGDV